MAILTTSARRRRRCLKLRWWFAWLAGLALFGSGPATVSAQTVISDENQIKAVFLFNFAQFVEWPARAFPGKEAPLVIGILGEDPFGNYLDELVSGEKIGERPL